METTEIIKVLNPAQIAILATIGVGVTELYGRIMAKDWFVVGKILVAVLTVTLICLSWGIGLVASLAIGFLPSGGLTVVGSVGNKSKPAPSELRVK